MNQLDAFTVSMVDDRNDARIAEIDLTDPESVFQYLLNCAQQEVWCFYLLRLCRWMRVIC